MNPSDSHALNLLQRTSIENVQYRLNHSHNELQHIELIRLQHAFLFLCSNIAPKYLFYLDRINHMLQRFSRHLIKHYIMERDILLNENSPRTYSQSSLALNRLRHDHQTLQEALSDLQAATEDLLTAKPSFSVKDFSTNLTTFADHLHQQILEENTVLIPRFSSPRLGDS